MKQKGTKAQKKGQGRKLSRFNLTRKGEIALAAVGVLVVATALFFGGALVYRALSSGRKAEAAAAAKGKAAHEARWEALQREGVVLGLGRERETVLVDPERWQAVLSTEKAPSAEAIRAHFGWRYVFLADSKTERKVGWYSAETGYRAVQAAKE